jgi:hypothetical protein
MVWLIFPNESYMYHHIVVFQSNYAAYKRLGEAVIGVDLSLHQPGKLMQV